MRIEYGCLPHPDFPLSRRELAGVLEAILAALGLPGADLSVRLADDREMASLNRRFLGCEGPTNVLSFPSQDETRLGDLALGVDTLAREARLYGQDPLAHLARLLAHGVLHLSGYDHGEEMLALTETAVRAVAEV